MNPLAFLEKAYFMIRLKTIVDYMQAVSIKNVEM